MYRGSSHHICRTYSVDVHHSCNLRAIYSIVEKYYYNPIRLVGSAFSHVTISVLT
jgi:hypothetical protein